MLPMDLLICMTFHGDLLLKKRSGLLFYRPIIRAELGSHIRRHVVYNQPNIYAYCRGCDTYRTYGVIFYNLAMLF